MKTKKTAGTPSALAVCGPTTETDPVAESVKFRKLAISPELKEFMHMLTSLEHHFDRAGDHDLCDSR